MRVIVEDVMTTELISVSGSAPFKDVAEAIIEHGVSAVPVVDAENRLIGVVSEADLLAKEEFREQYYREGYQPPLRARLRHRMTPQGRRKASGDTAAELMTSPVITIEPGASVATAARLMDQHGIKRLFVTTADGTPAGVVSRRDLIKVFLRGDEEIAAEIRDEIFGRVLWFETSGVQAAVERGVVTLRGSTLRRSEATIAVRLVRRVNGVVDVIDEITWKEDDTTWNGG